jgi:hypothetical protein
MFTIALEPTYEWPVTGKVPGGQEYSFVGVFRRMGKAELSKLATDAESLSDLDYVLAVLSGWRGVADAEGLDLEFTAANVAKVVDIVGIADAVARAFRDSIERAREKN